MSYFSKGGKYFGRLMSTGHINAARQRKQASLYHSKFAMELSREIVIGKLHNQSTVLYRYGTSSKTDVTKYRNMLMIMQKKVLECDDQAKIMGYEGLGARAYFSGLNCCIDKDFHFTGRSKRPPKDKFNSLISLGYSILMNEIYCKIESKGLNPYMGFIHQDAEQHPTLASDLMEEWRAVIVDSVAMSMINGHEIHINDFEEGEDGGIYLTGNGLKLFLNKMEKKMETRNTYLEDRLNHTFRGAMDIQLNKLVQAIENTDATIYTSLKIR